MKTRIQLSSVAALTLCTASACVASAIDESNLPVAERTHGPARSSSPPGELTAAEVRQLVTVSFDDNFSTEGMSGATGVLKPRTNPAGSGKVATLDGAPVRTSFFHNSLYL